MFAALGSLALHAALLALPLGHAVGDFAFPAETTRAIHATLIEWAPERELKADHSAAPVPQPAPPTDAPPVPERQAKGVKADDALPLGIVSAAAQYFDAAQLTELPRPLAEPALTALEERIAGEGEVRMTLYIDESGRVTAIDVRSTTLPPEIAAEAAAIFSHLPFAPGRIGPNAVRSRIGLNLGVASRQSYAR